MGHLTVPEAQALVDRLFKDMPPSVLDFVALAWRLNEYFEEGSAKALATVVTAGSDDPQRDTCLRLRAGDTNTLRAPYRDGLYVVLDPRKLAPATVDAWHTGGRIAEEAGMYGSSGAPWAIGVTVSADEIAACQQEVLAAHRGFVHAVSGGRSGARFQEFAENAVATVLRRRGRELESGDPPPR